MMSDVPYGVLLSGGLDSSVISAVAKKYSSRRVETNDETDAWWPQLHSFSVGLEGVSGFGSGSNRSGSYWDGAS